MEVLTQDYNIYGKNRGTRGGDVLVTITDSIPSYQVNLNSLVEMVIVEVHLVPKILICFVYAPPQFTQQLWLELLCQLNFLNYNCDIIIIGDFNCPDINWSSLSGTSPNSTSLCNFIFTHNFMQHISDPAYSHGNILDLFLSNCSNISIDDSICSSMSDHLWTDEWYNFLIDHCFKYF